MIDNDLVSNIAISSGSGIIVMTTTDLGNPVCMLTYTFSVSTVIFNSRPAITISVLDFLTLTSQFFIFNNAIINVLNPNQSSILNFNAMNTNESFDSHGNNWNFTASEGPGPNIVDYSANFASQNVTLKNRPSNITIPYSEWLSLLSSLNRYQSNVKQFIGI